MTLHIDHFPGVAFYVCNREVGIDIHKSVKEKLGKEAQLTNATALKILKEIKWKSDVLCFLTKPVVAISLSAAVLVAGFCIPAVGVALLAARIFVCSVGGGMVGFSVGSSVNGFLSQLSDAYSQQSRMAAIYIEGIEGANQEIKFTFA